MKRRAAQHSQCRDPRDQAQRVSFHGMIQPQHSSIGTFTRNTTAR